MGNSSEPEGDETEVAVLLRRGGRDNLPEPYPPRCGFIVQIAEAVPGDIKRRHHDGQGVGWRRPITRANARARWGSWYLAASEAPRTDRSTPQSADIVKVRLSPFTGGSTPSRRNVSPNLQHAGWRSSGAADQARTRPPPPRRATGAARTAAHGSPVTRSRARADIAPERLSRTGDLASDAGRADDKSRPLFRLPQRRAGRRYDLTLRRRAMAQSSGLDAGR